MDVEDIKLSNMKVDKADEVPYIVMKGVKNAELENFQNVKNRVIAAATDKEVAK